MTEEEAEDLERIEGLCVGQLRRDEMELFERAVREGHARRSYEGMMGLLGLPMVRLVYVPSHRARP